MSRVYPLSDGCGLRVDCGIHLVLADGRAIKLCRTEDVPHFCATVHLIGEDHAASLRQAEIRALTASQRSLADSIRLLVETISKDGAP